MVFVGAVTIRSVVTAAGVAIAGLLASCSSTTTSGPPVAPAVGSTDSRALPADSAAVRQIALVPAKILGASAAQALTSMPWRLTSIDDRTHTIGVVYVTGSGCVTPRGIYLHETATEVLIAVLSKTDSGQGACADYLAVSRSVLRLREPLGGRVLLHAVVDPAWSSSGLLDGLTG